MGLSVKLKEQEWITVGKAKITLTEARSGRAVLHVEAPLSEKIDRSNAKKKNQPNGPLDHNKGEEEC